VLGHAHRQRKIILTGGALNPYDYRTWQSGSSMKNATFSGGSYRSEVGKKHSAIKFQMLNRKR